MDLSSVVILEGVLEKIMTKHNRRHESRRLMNWRLKKRGKKNFIVYATREKYKANMIINLYSYGPPNEFRISKGIFTKNTVVYPHSVKLLTETFTLDRMRKIFSERITRQWTKIGHNERSVGPKRNSHLSPGGTLFQAITIKGNNWNDTADPTIHGDRRPTLIGRHGSDRVQFT